MTPADGVLLAERTGKLRRAVTAEAAALMATSSFLDRLRGTGPLSPGRAHQHGALGPVGKAAGYADDDRLLLLATNSHSIIAVVTALA
jgi:Ni,Fe-hydrogenase III large subunit